MKQKLFQTELGTEKHCTCCGELYPVHKDFFYQNGKDSKGNQRFVAQCKDCYITNYKPERRKSA